MGIPLPDEWPEIIDAFYYSVTMDHFAGLPIIDGCKGPFLFSPTCCRKGDTLNLWIDTNADCSVGQALCAAGGGFDQERLKNITGPFSDSSCLIPV